MFDDDRLGLPLSLVEALRADSSPIAATLAGLLEQDRCPPRSLSAAPAQGRARRWRMALASLGLASMGLAAGSATQACAGTGSLEGHWTMARAQSSFLEQVTGPAPDQATVVFTRDDPDHLTYELDESRRGAPVAHGAYDVSFDGAISTSSVDGKRLPVTAVRDAEGDVVIRAPAVNGLQAVIRVRRTGPDTALLEHEVQSINGDHQLERISLVRSETSPD